MVTIVALAGTFFFSGLQCLAAKYKGDSVYKWRNRTLVLLDGKEVLMDLLQLGPLDLIFEGKKIVKPMCSMEVGKYVVAVREDSGN
jgi:hypothetical protein